MSPNRQFTAVYTTIYPGVENYLRDFFQSVRDQTDKDFDLWIGLDGLKPKDVKQAARATIDAYWVEDLQPVTPASIRQKALYKIVKHYDAVMLVDSDDLLDPTRVEAAKKELIQNQLSGCALRLIDRTGKDLGKDFCRPAESTPESIFPHKNIFGFSNSVFHCDLIEKCLPIPAEAVLIDWFLVTRAWLLGAKIGFDFTVRMYYRQHGNNTAVVIPELTREQILLDALRVKNHYEFILNSPLTGAVPERIAQVQEAAVEAGEFLAALTSNPAMLAQYVTDINTMQLEPVWWAHIAHPSLAHIWKI